MAPIKELALTIIAVNGALGVLVALVVYIMRDKIINFILSSIAERESDFDRLVIHSIKRQVILVQSAVGDGGLGEIRTSVARMEFMLGASKQAIDSLLAEVRTINHQYNQLSTTVAHLSGVVDGIKSTE